MEGELIRLFHCSSPRCPATFKSKYNLKRHVDTVHFHLKSFQCNSCCKYLSSRQSLLDHLDWHSGETAYECTKCRKTFNKSSQLARHKRIHRLKKPLSSSLPQVREALLTKSTDLVHLP
mmetsp:Transcript_34383/g.60258  ORF Transcript_34383/g.60258 Transcript_34383/m.60258 type:complete len:119 (-) Transcript_34383:638-994(-)